VRRSQMTGGMVVDTANADCERSRGFSERGFPRIGLTRRPFKTAVSASAGSPRQIAAAKLLENRVAPAEPFVPIGTRLNGG